MQITNNLPPFTKTTLLLITSRQDAKAYLLHDHEASELFKLHYDKPEYTDKEGSFDRSSKNGQRVGGGETDKQIDQLAYTEFLNELTKQLDQSSLDSVEEVVLFAPEHLANQTTKHLPHTLQTKITKTVHGNLIHESLNDLVSRISQ